MDEREFFGGPASAEMWADINAVKDTDERAWIALYGLACKLQEFEAYMKHRSSSADEGPNG